MGLGRVYSIICTAHTCSYDRKSNATGRELHHQWRLIIVRTIVSVACMHQSHGFTYQAFPLFTTDNNWKLRVWPSDEAIRPEEVKLMSVGKSIYELHLALSRAVACASPAQLVQTNAFNTYCHDRSQHSSTIIIAVRSLAAKLHHEVVWLFYKLHADTNLVSAVLEKVPPECGDELDPGAAHSVSLCGHFVPRRAR